MFILGLMFFLLYKLVYKNFVYIFILIFIMGGLLWDIEEEVVEWFRGVSLFFKCGY